MTDTVRNTPRERSIKTGERIAVLSMAFFIGLEIITLAIIAINGMAIPLTSVVRLTLTIISCFYLYKGKNWARLLLTFAACLALIRGVFGLYIALTNPAISFAGYMSILMTTIFSGVTAYYLFFSSDLDAFLQSRKR